MIAWQTLREQTLQERSRGNRRGSAKMDPYMIVELIRKKHIEQKRPNNALARGCNSLQSWYLGLMDRRTKKRLEEFEAPKKPRKNSIKGWEATLYLFALFYISGVVYFEHAAPERLNARDGLYFLTVTLCMVGYGDIFPADRAGRVVCTLGALLGVLALCCALTEVTHVVLNQRERAAMKAQGAVLRFGLGCKTHAEAVKSITNALASLSVSVGGTVGVPSISWEIFLEIF